jgi:hypothetical protein
MMTDHDATAAMAAAALDLVGHRSQENRA